MLKRLLVSVSETPNRSPECGIALQIAKAKGASVTGFTAVDANRLAQVGPASVGAFSYRQKLVEARLSKGREGAAKALREMGRICSDAELDYRSLSQETAADMALLDAWRFHDLAITSTRPWIPGENEKGDAHAILHLVAHGLRPILAVPPEASPQLRGKALVALSGSLESAKSFKHFVQMAPSPETEVHIVTVGDPKTGERAEELLSQAYDYALAHGLKVTTAALPKAKNRTETLLAEAEKVGAGVFVIGSSYRRFLALERFGSHATGILGRATIPVFVSH